MMELGHVQEIDAALENGGGRSESLSGRPFQEIISKSPLILLKEAGGLSELRAAFSLVHDLYVKSGYMDPHPSGMRYAAAQLTPYSRTTVIKRNFDVVGTGSVVMDDFGCLPSEQGFGHLFDSLRKKGRRIAEGTLLGCIPVPELPAGKLSLEVIRLGFGFCAAEGVDDFCVVVNPKHLKFWHKDLGFEIVGEQQSCSHVKGAPGHLVRYPIRELNSGEWRPNEFFQSTVGSRPIAGAKLKERILLSGKDVASLLSERPEILGDLTFRGRTAPESNLGSYNADA